MTERINFQNHCIIPTKYGDFDFHLFTQEIDGITKEHLALVMGEVRDKVNVLVRIHSECCTGDIFGCQRCDCHDQLHHALNSIRRRGSGVLVYLRQEGRGIGLKAKIDAYKLQDEGMDTVEANLALGYEADNRDYSIASDILKFLEVKSVDIITNNSNKVAGLETNDIPVNKRVPIQIRTSSSNRDDLFRVKQEKLGHLFDKLEDFPVLELTKSPYPLITPSMFYRDSPLPELTIDNTEKVKEICIETFGDNLLLILLQGSNMRGDGSIQESDFDYIILLKKYDNSMIEKIAKIKERYPRSNFLFVTEDEYKTYPLDSKLQFFITRRVHGDYDLGSPPSKDVILETAIKFAISLKDGIRPLIFQIIEEPDNKIWIEKSHTLLKRFDDCFLRVVCLYLTGKYPLHRDDLRNIANAESINQITDVINKWYGGNIVMKDVYEALKICDRLINIFLRKVSKNRI